MKHAPNLFFVGPMGAGKTTIGRHAAQLLDLPFHDLDRDIEECTGVTVHTVFDIEGESGFRERETNMLQKLAAETGIVLATGGGAVLREANRQLLRSRGFVVWLDASVDIQLTRLVRDRQRPLLNSGNKYPDTESHANDRRARLEQLAAQRNPLYAEVADLHLTSCGSGSSSHLARQLAAQLAECWQPDMTHIA